MTALACLAGAVLVLLLAHAGGGPAAARLPVAVAAMWLLPGAALARLSGRRDPDFAGGLAWAFGGSAAWLALAAATCHALRLPPRALADLTAGLLAALGLLLLRAGPRRAAAGGATPLAINLAQAAVLAVVGAFLLARGGTLAQTGDSLDHLAYMKTILSDHSVLPVREFYREVTSQAIDLRKGFLHAPLAVTAAVSGLDPAGLWKAWPAFVAPCLAACFYVLARALSPGRSGAALATVLFLGLYGGPGQSFFMKAGYPNKTSDALVWLAWAGVITALRASGRWIPGTGGPGGKGPARGPAGKADIAADLGPPAPPFPVAWLLAGATMIHVFAAAPWFFGVGAFTVVAALVPSARPSAGRTLRTLLAAAACCAPILAWRFLVSYQPVNPMHTRLQGLLLLPFGYVLEPMSWVAVLGQATWLTLLVTPFFLAHRPTGARLLAVVAVWAPVALLFNPALLPLVAPRLGYLVIRLFPPALVLCVLGVWLADQVRALLRGGAGPRVRAVAWLAAAAVLVAPDLRAAVRGYGREAMTAEAAHSPGPWRASREFLGRSYPQPRVVASDPITCYGVAGLTRHDVIATLNQHSSPSDSEALARMQAASDILSPGCPPARTAELLKRYRVDLVLVNHTYPYRLLDYMASMDPSEYPAIEAKFAAHPEVFREVFRAPGQYVYEVRGEALDTYAGLPGPVWPEVQPPPAHAPRDMGAGTWSAGLEVAPARVTPGDSVLADFLLRRERPTEPGERFVAELSLATPCPGGPRWLPPRLRRAFVQHQEHRLYRISYFLPVQGPGGSPEYWPVGRWVRWRAALYVPSGAGPGRYALRARFRRQEFQPSVNVPWYLQEDDDTPGGVLDSVEVLPWRARAAAADPPGGRRP